MVEVDYSLLNRAPEDDVLPYCQEHGIAVLVRGPLRQGLLAGKYDLDTVFTDTVRATWNAGGAPARRVRARRLAKVERLKQAVEPGDEMVTAALRYVIFSHPRRRWRSPAASRPRRRS